MWLCVVLVGMFSVISMCLFSFRLVLNILWNGLVDMFINCYVCWWLCVCISIMVLGYMCWIRCVVCMFVFGLFRVIM